MTHGLSSRQAAKRAQIAKAARKLFLAQGYAATSMDAVTAEAGVSKQTLYNYFPTKIDLLTEVLGDSLDRIDSQQSGQPRIETVDDLRRVLLQFASGFTRAVLTPDTVALMRLILGEVSRIPELRRSFRVAFPGRLMDASTELVRVAAAKGLVSTASPEMSGRMFIGPLMTFIALDGFLNVTDEITPPTDADLEFIVDAFLATMQVPR
ncbi:MAG TPA: TetR/AcrR family transcriptional regulator [Propionicimonas sp.]|nr:TetR/AcrR family transcriptional regulator [Propionicimonas sp.]HRA06762.1 TetR/AcrR family transcriptional regulator [Propionicimonas sp.]